jgi:hypothetical protein
MFGGGTPGVGQSDIGRLGGRSQRPLHQGDYYLTTRPSETRSTPTGTAVRAMYLYCAMANHLRRSGDESMEKGAGGAVEERDRPQDVRHRRNRFPGPLRTVYDRWDLPSDTADAETCAAIGLAMWSWRMQLVAPRRDYAEVLSARSTTGPSRGSRWTGRGFSTSIPWKWAADREGAA